MRYPFVLFDAGETLFGPRETFGATYARILGPVGIDVPGSVFESSLREVWSEMDRTIPRGTDRYRYFEGGEDGYWLRFARETIQRAAGRPISSAFAEEALGRLRAAFREVEAWEVFPDVVPALTVLRGWGARTGIVSNWDSRLPGLLEMLDLARFFDAVTFSHFEGMEKPEPELFRRALGRLGAHPRAALHVGDVPALDMDGARAAGIDCVLVDRRGRLDATLGALSDLSLLPRIIEKGLISTSGGGERAPGQEFT